jgi:hypothetical protein
MRELHWSDISQIMRCGTQSFLRKQYGNRPGNRFAWRGTGTHAGVEYNLRHKLDKGVYAPRDEVEDCAGDTVVRGIEQSGLMLLPRDKGKSIGAIRGEAKDGAVRLAGLHYDKVAPRIEAVNVERQWALDFPSRGIRLAGRIDIETPCGVRDTKTANKTPNARTADLSDQLTMYAMAYRVLNGRMPTELALDNLVDLETPKAVPLDTTRTEADFKRLIAKIDAALKVIETGAYMPTDRGNWWCSPDWCGYYDLCPYV